MADAAKSSEPANLRQPAADRTEGGPQRELSEAAMRALAEAEERRMKLMQPLAPEINGRDGLEPVRYGDWEVKGMATDF